MYTQCFLGSELVDWLIRQQKANTRVQAATLSQALLDGNYIEAFLDSNIFVDGHVWYQKGNFTQLNTNIDTSRQDSSWVQQLPHESSNTDSDSELLSPSLPGISTSNSYTLNLNVEANSAYLSRPLDSPNDEQLPTSSCKHDEGITAIRLSEQRELAPESGWFDASCLREENNEKEAYELLSEAYEQHEQSLLKQLLSVRGLSFSWNNILIPLTREIVTVIRPDKKHDAEQLDIKDYVQVKKLPGGNKEDTYLVNGIVFTKNVVHKDMVVDFENPSILLLECSVVYQRTQGRFMSIEPVMMQEQEYLRHAVARIVTLQPQVVLVQKNISRLAQDMLRQHGITLIHNVKRTVLERLSRCLEADIVNALDAHIGRPKLGSCKRFYLKIFDTVKGAKKTLMFFEGLPNPHLGATVLLRGPKSELERVKSVTSFLIFTAYNWRLEKSFLMDEFALPPNSRMEFLDESKDNSPQELNFKGTTVWEKPDKKTASDLSETQSVSEHKKILVQSVNDHSDPLQSGEDKVRDNTSEETLTVTELPQENNFKKHLEDTILCISPYVIFPMPYLETDAGKKCKLRRFFYKDMYFSEQFELNHKNKWKTVETTIENSEMKTKDLHPFLNEKITNANDHRIQNLLAHFRACGSQFSKTEILHVIESEIKGGKAIKPQLDVLDPMNHQRLAVLFYSFSHESNNAPAFCVDPWVVYMDFYGKNDIPLGCFLEKYCFRTTYACSSKACITPMDNHIRRFVHNSGSVTVVLNRFEDKYDEKEIVMWSSCTKCSFVSPVVSLSTDSWSYSFAKYLELRFHGEIFSRRGPNSCRHSLHHDHYQYFGYNNYVASFKYSPINIWEISLPPSVINLKLDFPKNHDNFIEQAKSLAQKGHDLFNLILEKSSGIIGDELEGVGNIKHLLAKEQNNFKQKIEQLQLTLTSPTIEEKKFDLQASTQNYWKIQEDLTRLKGILVDLVDTWNTHLGEAIRKSDKKKEKPLIIDVDSPISETSEGELAAEVIDSQEDIIVPRIEDSSTDSKKEFKKEKSMKNLLDKFLPSSGQASIIQSPFSSQEHYNLPAGVYGLMPVYELEVSSIIAYALNSLDYKRKMEEMHKSHVAEQTPSPIVKRKNIEKSEDNSGLLGFLRNKDMASAGADYGNIEQAVAVAEDGRKAKNLHVEIEFKDATCSFFCCIYLAEKFAALRAAVVPFGEEGFIRSLNRCIQWRAVGGKSGSSFHKTVGKMTDL
ncbi:hypothetical protein ABEB36_001133 [Hypothenemus hampei]|uniref:DEP domain-containing protein n=1 Tax=Hypothenemus hampei TaxID=57062 RepID=A0ABD1FDL1_HYPHA